MFDNHPGALQPPSDARIDARGYDFLYWLNATDTLADISTTRFYGYLAASKTNPGDVVIAIRGTRGAGEWIIDFLAAPKAF